MLTHQVIRKVLQLNDSKNTDVFHSEACSISGWCWALSFDLCPLFYLFICFSLNFFGLAWLCTESGTEDCIRPVKHEIVVCWLTMCKGAQETKHDIIVLRASNMNLINHDSRWLIILFTMSWCTSFHVVSLTLLRFLLCISLWPGCFLFHLS